MELGEPQANVVEDKNAAENAKTMTLLQRMEQMKSPYLVIDLPTWRIRYSSSAPDLTDNTCRRTELWLRRIEPGTFMMGGPQNELGRGYDEFQHQVTLTRPYYIGVFECTQRQWELVTGHNPSSRFQGDTRPVENVSYDDIRGKGTGAGWPTSGHKVDADSFLGILQAKTGLPFDLPTEAEWEFACRAGTTTSLNSGRNLTDEISCPNMAEVGRYFCNRNNGRGGYSETHTKVGSYLPNAWGLYDMHGNVWEWCLDWFDVYPAAAEINPKGATTGSNRVYRGGGWYSRAWCCRAACRVSGIPSYRLHNLGFRLALVPVQ